MRWKLTAIEPKVAALDFAPEILAIEQRPPSPMPRAVLYALLTLFAILSIWAVVGKLDIVASAQGKLVPQTYVKIVQPADAGIVKEILVKEGDRVAAGQVLLRLDTTLLAADSAIVAKEIQLRELQLHRIDAQLSGQPMSAAGHDQSRLLAERSGASGEAGETDAYLQPGRRVARQACRAGARAEVPIFAEAARTH